MAESNNYNSHSSSLSSHYPPSSAKASHPANPGSHRVDPIPAHQQLPGGPYGYRDGSVSSGPPTTVPANIDYREPTASHQYFCPDAPGSTPRTAYQLGGPHAGAGQWSTGFPAAGHLSTANDHDHSRHAPYHMPNYPNPAWDSHNQRPAFARPPPPFQDQNFTHPHNMAGHYSHHPRPPHQPVEPAAAPSPPNNYPNSPRTPAPLAHQALPMPQGLRQSSSHRASIASMSAPVNGNLQHQENPQQESRHEYVSNQHSEQRGYLVNPSHGSQVLNSSVPGPPPSLDVNSRSEGRDRSIHNMGTLTPVEMSRNTFNSPISPPSGMSSIGPRDNREGDVNFDRNNYSSGSSARNQFDYNKGADRGASTEDNSYSSKTQSGQTVNITLPTEEAGKIATHSNQDLPHDHYQNNQDNDYENDGDETEEECGIKREASSRTASPTSSPRYSSRQSIPTTVATNATIKKGSDSPDSSSNDKNGSGEAPRKRGGPVMVDHNGKQYYEVDEVPKGLEIPPGYQLGYEYKCKKKNCRQHLLPLTKEGIKVNPDWGLTDNLKARQRLPAACSSCHQKKIKCVEGDPDPSICKHCAKMGFDCVVLEPKSRNNSKKERDDEIGPNIGPSSIDSASPVIQPSMDSINSGRRSAGGHKKRKASNDSQKATGTLKRGKSSRASSFSAEPLDTAMSGMEDNYSSRVRQQPPRHHTTPVQAERKLMFALQDDTVMPIDNRSDERRSISKERSKHYYTQQLAQQYYGQRSATETPPNSYTSASPPNSGSNMTIDHHTPLGIHTSGCPAGSKGAPGLTPKALIGTSPIPSVPHPIGEDPRHSRIPGPNVLEHMVETYFTHVYSQTYAFLHRKSFTENLHQHPPVLLWSLCAVASRFSEEYNRHQEEFAIPARTLILENFDNNSLEVVQSMIHMGLHDFGSNNGNKAWMFCGMAVRMGGALNLNLERKKEKGKGQSPVSREIARRTYWSYYMMDRLNSYGVGRAFLVQDHDCHIQLPCNQPSFHEGRFAITKYLLGPNPYHPDHDDQNMGAMAYLVRIVSIWGEILRQIHFSGITQQKNKQQEESTEFHNFIEKLENWRKKLPTGLEYSNENLAGQIKAGTVGAFVMMHVMWHTSMAYVHRYVRTSGHLMEDVPKASIVESIRKASIVESIRKAFVHADAVLQIMSHVQERRKEAENNKNKPVTVNAPFIGQAISDAANLTVIRALEVSGEPGGDRDQKARVFVGLEWLRELKKYWRPIDGMYKRLKKKCRVLEKSMSFPPASRRNPILPSPDSTHADLSLVQNVYHFPVDPNNFETPPMIGHEQIQQNILQQIDTQYMDFMYSVPGQYYVDAFASPGTFGALYGIAEAEGGFPNLYLDSGTSLGGMEQMPVGLSTPVSAPFDSGMPSHAGLGPSPLPHASYSEEGLHNGEHREFHEPESDEDQEEEEKDSPEKRKDIERKQIAVCYFDPNAARDGKMAGGDTSGSDSSGSESRQKKEAVPKSITENNPMDLLHLLGEVVNEVSQVVDKKNETDLMTGRKGVAAPSDGEMEGEIHADNDKEDG